MPEGRKDILNLEVLHFTFLYLRPEGWSVSSPCRGWVGSLRMEAAGLTHSSVTIPHGDAAGQDALNNTVVEVVEKLLWHARLPQKVQPLLSLLNYLGGVECPGEVLADVNPQVFKSVHPLHFKLSDKQWLVSSPLFSNVHYYVLCLVRVEGEVVVLSPCHKTGHLPPVGRFIPASDPSITLVSSANVTMMLPCGRRHSQGRRSHGGRIPPHF